MKTIDVAKDLALPVSEGNPLKVDGELSRDGIPTSGAIPFRGENVDLFLRLLGLQLAQNAVAPDRSEGAG